MENPVVWTAIYPDLLLIKHVRSRSDLDWDIISGELTEDLLRIWHHRVNWEIVYLNGPTTKIAREFAPWLHSGRMSLNIELVKWVNEINRDEYIRYNTDWDGLWQN